MHFQHLGLLGYGEVGRIFAAGLGAHFASVRVWDIDLRNPAPGVQACASLQDLAQNCDLVISAVTAANTLAVAQEAAQYLRAGTVFLDLNSASPGTKVLAAQAVEAVGAHYVEAGVMTSVPPHGIRVPMLLGGPQAQTMALRCKAMGMDATAVAPTIGVASAIKMCRSVMIKGLEALVIESYTTARAYGVEAHVLPTLAETFPSIDWEKTGGYFFSRVAQHGKRRAEEMRECAKKEQPEDEDEHVDKAPFAMYPFGCRCTYVPPDETTTAKKAEKSEKPLTRGGEFANYARP